MKLWQKIRPVLVRGKKWLVDRPLGLKHFGAGAAIVRPRRVEGRQWVKVGARSLILPDSNIWALGEYAGKAYTPRIVIGDDVYIGRHVFLSAINGLIIGDGCVLSESVYITDFLHGFNPEAGPIMKQELQSKGPVEIKAHCFLGLRVSVMPGVTLGEHCVVGTNSVVTKSFPPYSMIGGVPARLLKTYSHEEKLWVSVSHVL